MSSQIVRGRVGAWLAGALALSLSACASPAPKPTPSSAATTAQRFEGLGDHTRTVATSNPTAQRYFDQGLAFLYAFNHDEARRSFEAAAAFDPSCAMAYWGIAMSRGPHINWPMLDEANGKIAFDAVSRAVALRGTAHAADRALIDAIVTRYRWPVASDRRALDEAYAAAMGTAHQQHPADADIAALFAEAMMDLRPWDLWTQGGLPQPGTEEIVALLERTLVAAPRHPLANHLYVHAIEASPTPERAQAAADTLRDLQPGLGHLVHMPSHIDVRIGHWQAAIAANERARAADERYRGRVPEQQFYRVYMAHNDHMLAFAAMMVGRQELATRSIRAMVDAMPADWVKENSPIADGFVAMPYEVLLRFGSWNEVLREPPPPAYLPFATALRLYARGVAQAALKMPAAARAEQAAFRAARRDVPAEAAFGNNSVHALLDVAEQVLEGEILLREGKNDAAIEALKLGVIKEDALRYDEPPDWIQPVRHVLGAVLIDAGRLAEAETVYRDDLRRLPGNGWALYGLSETLRTQGRVAEADTIQDRFELAWADADLSIDASCLCVTRK